MVADFDVIDFLHVLTDRSVQLLDVSAAGLLLADPRGELRVVAASVEAARLLELFQLQNDQGPCLDCFRAGRPVAAADLAAEAQRWPRFAAAAQQAGFAAVQALPMRLRDQVIGALNLFRAVPGAFDPADIRAGRRGHHQPAARAQHAPQRHPERAAAGRAEQPGHHRAGQG
jgi:transcriptional regulator with GAF, ATPase, and Fis domain